MWFAQLILVLAAAYAVVGIVFAAAFLTIGLARIDPATHGARWTVRLLLAPGTIALWPLLLARWRAAARSGGAP